MRNFQLDPHTCPPNLPGRCKILLTEPLFQPNHLYICCTLSNHQHTPPMINIKSTQCQGKVCGKELKLLSCKEKKNPGNLIKDRFKPDYTKKY